MLWWGSLKTEQLSFAFDGVDRRWEGISSACVMERIPSRLDIWQTQCDVDNVEDADVILIGISRTSKTPTSIYLAQRGYKTFNIPLVPGNELPQEVIESKHPLVVALIASADRIQQVRENRLLAFDRELSGDTYVDRASIQEELAWTRRLCKQNNWPMIDVSKRSVEETAAAILALRNHPA